MRKEKKKILRKRPSAKSCLFFASSSAAGEAPPVRNAMYTEKQKLQSCTEAKACASARGAAVASIVEETTAYLCRVSEISNAALPACQTASCLRAGSAEQSEKRPAKKKQ